MPEDAFGVSKALGALCGERHGVRGVKATTEEAQSAASQRQRTLCLAGDKEPVSCPPCVKSLGTPKVVS